MRSSKEIQRLQKMGVLCHTCQGSGRSAGFGPADLRPGRMACNLCEGRGYRHDNRRTAEATTVDVGKVLAYDPMIGTAYVSIEETLNRGDKLIAICHGLAVEFELRTMVVAGMNLPMALRGWEVAMLVPQPLQPGTWIMRKEV
jgi:hypothetical protein